MKTAEDFAKQAIDKNITEWRMHQCSICGYPCGYIIRGEQVFYDSGCNCVRYRSALHNRTFQDIANHYNSQDNENYITEMNKFWGFSSEQKVKECDATGVK